MGEVSIIGVDLAKNVFQVHGAAADGSVVYRKKLSRPQFARFMVKALWPMEMAEGNIVKARRKDVRRHRMRAADQNPALGAFTLNATRAVEVPSSDKGQITHDLLDGCNDFRMEGPCCGFNAEPGLCV